MSSETGISYYQGINYNDGLKDFRIVVMFDLNPVSYVADILRNFCDMSNMKF